MAEYDDFTVGIDIKMTWSKFAEFAENQGMAAGNIVFTAFSYDEASAAFSGDEALYSEVEAFSDDGFTWLKIEPDNLIGNTSPSELMTSALERRDNSVRWNAMIANMNVSYIGQAVLAWLPAPLHDSNDNLDIYGFLDHRNKFGLAYGWDVFASLPRTTFPEILSANDPTSMGATSTIDFASDWYEVSKHSNVLGLQYRYYPPYRTDESTNLSWKNAWADQIYNAFTTYCVEAVGIDYMDSISSDYIAGGEVPTANPNYILSSNEIFPVDPNILEWSPSWTHHAMHGDEFRIGWGDASPDGIYSTMMKMRYAAKGTSFYGTFTSSDQISSLGSLSSAGTADVPSSGANPKRPWSSRLGTHSWEKDCLNSMIDWSCQQIQDGYEVIDLPKKLLNKVQKRGRIPDSVVSAFGYIAPDDDAYRTMLAGTAGGIEGLADALQMNIGDVQFGDPDPASATSITPSGTPWTYTDADGVERSVTWEEYVEATGAGSGFDTGTFGEY